MNTKLIALVAKAPAALAVGGVKGPARTAYYMERK